MFDELSMQSKVLSGSSLFHGDHHSKNHLLVPKSLFMVFTVM